MKCSEIRFPWQKTYISDLSDDPVDDYVISGRTDESFALNCDLTTIYSVGSGVACPLTI